MISLKYPQAQGEKIETRLKATLKNLHWDITMQIIQERVFTRVGALCHEKAYTSTAICSSI